MAARPLAHSAPTPDRAPQFYGDHIEGAVRVARANAEAVAAFMPDKERARCFVAAVIDGATYHDLGKLDPDNQEVLRQGRKGVMRWDHIDAGVAHLLSAGAQTAAWIGRAHHAPGLPARAAEINSLNPNARRLRGGRDPKGADALTAHTDQTLPQLLAAHALVADPRALLKSKARHGLFMRLALSCLVDGDHTDSAWFEHDRRPPDPTPPRWAERLARLDDYIAGLPKGHERQADRDAFYAACREAPVEASMVACEGSVGIGKTTAVTAWCLRRAIKSGARRVFVVAPYTTILSQTADTLRRALVLPHENEHSQEIVAEHHHRADFDSLDSRDLATLWRAPIVVTTGVQFFETLAGCKPAHLRKLHGLPGSVVFLDEAHAALAAPLWRQNWAWMRELASEWGCSFVFASGSLARVWEEPDIVGEKETAALPNIVPPTLAARLDEAEHARVRYGKLRCVTDPVSAILGAEHGPRLAIFNTVQTAAVVADRLRKQGADVLHLSTALCPSDRDRTLGEIRRRLDPGISYCSNWTLVATSLVEAGVDLSLRTALRERFSTASLIQVGGRANRHGGKVPGEVFDFQLNADADMTTHPGAARSASVLGRFLEEGSLDGVFNAASLVTRALRDEVRDDHGGTGAPLAEAETERDYPMVAQLGRLIDADTALVVVDAGLKNLLATGANVSARDFLAGSVQIWSTKIKALGLSSIPGRPGVYVWPRRYDPKFLGYMAGVLDFRSEAAWVI